MNKLRSWVTPITIGSFLLLGFTGLLMFFKVRGGLIVVAHEWLSPIFVIAAGLHVWLNWGAIRASLSKARGIIIVSLFTILLVFSIAPFKEAEKHAREHGHGQEVIGSKAEEILLRASIKTVAELTGRTTQQLRFSLAQKGVHVASDETTLADAARLSQVSPERVLEAVLDTKSDTALDTKLEEK